MSLRTVRVLAFAFASFVVLSASDCGGMTFSDIVTGHSATITVRNNGPEPVAVALYADDASNTGTVPPHGSPTITTHIDGTYTVVVLPGLPSHLDSTLRSLKTATQDLYRANASGAPVELSSASQRIAEAKDKLAVVKHPELALASCVGVIKFPGLLTASPKPIELEASITKNADGSWSAACPSI